MLLAIPSWFVCVIGMGIVFLGLLGLVLICQLLGAICGSAASKKPSAPAVSPAVVSVTEIPNKQEFIAAVSVAIAEEMGEDVSAIRITSVRRI